MARVLVVDDNPDGRETLRFLLRLSGHEVAIAGDGVEGFQTALDWRPEAAVLDIGLPRMDGYQLASRLRAALGSGLTLVALTGYGTPKDRERALQAGFDFHLTKPTDPDVVLRLLDSRCPSLPVAS